MAIRPLSPVEARVLGTLMEKARTVPDSYPLTLNTVVTGCNQKTSRDPLMNVSEVQAQAALDDLKTMALVFESSGGRAARYEHNFQRVVGVPDQSAALLGLLLLRGPQTAGELRINTERWHRFADISSVEAFLDELQSRPAEKGGPLVVQLPRAPGEREQRWAQLLCGPVELAATTPAAPLNPGSPASTPPQGLAALQQRVDDLEKELAALRATVQELTSALGLPAPAEAAVSHPGQA